MYLSSSLGNLVLKQSLWYLLGFFFLFLIIKHDNNFFYKNAYIFYIISCLLLLGLLFFAPSINGSKCWYNILGFSFQPSEFVKISLILVYSRIIGEFNKKRKIDFKDEIKLFIKIFIILFSSFFNNFIKSIT